MEGKEESKSGRGEEGKSASHGDDRHYLEKRSSVTKKDHSECYLYRCLLRDPSQWLLHI